MSLNQITMFNFDGLRTKQALARVPGKPNSTNVCYRQDTQKLGHLGGHDPFKCVEKGSLDNDCGATPDTVGGAGEYLSFCEPPASLRRVGKILSGLNLLAEEEDDDGYDSPDEEYACPGCDLC
eukprot:GEMP01093200.1.p1 GENE.GEMP01093200.1~~GEMP01093200.1.p1  ORF type:complete len:123 (+),score=26.59 GEMP01093200.1:84-452(+)